MNVYSRILPYLKPYRLRFVQAGLAMGCVAACQGVLAYVLRNIVNNALNSKELWLLWTVVFGLPLLVLVKNIAAYIQNYLMSWLGQRITQDIREKLFRHIHILGLDFLAERKSGDILARVTNDLNTLQSTLNFIPLYLIRDSLTVVALVGVLFILNWRFACFALITIPGISSTLIVLGRKMRSASMQSQTIMGQIYTRFQESLQGMTVIKAYNYEEGAIEKFREENALFFNQMMRYLRATALSGPLMEFAGAIILAFFIYFGYKQTMAGHMRPGDAAAFLFAFIAAYAPIKNLARLQSELQRGIASGERIFQLLDEKPTIVVRPGALRFNGLDRGIRVDGVTFHYPGRERSALKNLNIHIHRGEMVAVVGPSGSGKSTLVHLLLRLYDPTQGAVLYDGIDLREMDTSSVREQIGLVTQDTILFNDTVFHNVALGRRGAPENVARGRSSSPNVGDGVTISQVEEACRIADAADFIAQLPQGYQTPLGDRGAKLSGGQRQRLAIARAVLKNPSILILDEATSSLDSASEESVQKALDRLMNGRTVLVIAHRLSAVAKADRTYVLDQGEIVQEGTHQTLLARAGLYRKLYDIQQSQPQSELVPSP